MVTLASDRVSEGKTLASDRCGRGLRQGLCGRVCKGARVQGRMRQGNNDKNEGDLALNRVTSRCSGQRRDVPEKKVFNVATFQRIVIINVVTLDINVATFQRGEKSTSRRSREGSK